MTARGFRPGIRRFDYVVFVRVLGREAASLHFDHIWAKKKPHKPLIFSQNLLDAETGQQEQKRHNKPWHQCI